MHAFDHLCSLLRLSYALLSLLSGIQASRGFPEVSFTAIPGFLRCPRGVFYRDSRLPGVVPGPSPGFPRVVQEGDEGGCPARVPASSRTAGGCPTGRAGWTLDSRIARVAGGCTQGGVPGVVYGTLPVPCCTTLPGYTTLLYYPPVLPCLVHGSVPYTLLGPACTPPGGSWVPF